MRDPSKRRRRVAVLLSLLFAVMFAGLASAVVILTHTFPAVTANTVLSSTCTNLQVHAVPFPSTTVNAGSTGRVIFDCSPGPADLSVPALHVDTAGSTTPVFTKPVAYLNIYIYDYSTPALSNPTCSSSFAGAVLLTTGVPQAFAGTPVNWNYCADYTNAPVGGFPTFTLTWNQP